jgi:hypothetical protein
LLRASIQLGEPNRLHIREAGIDVGEDLPLKQVWGVNLMALLPQRLRNVADTIRQPEDMAAY